MRNDIDLHLKRKKLEIARKYIKKGGIILNLDLFEIKVQVVHQRQNFLFENQELLGLRLLNLLGKYLYK